MGCFTGSTKIFRRKPNSEPIKKNVNRQSGPGAAPVAESTHEELVNTGVDTQPLDLFPDGILELQSCSDATVDICFIHGLAGDRRSTWTALGETSPWPELLLPQKLNRARILTYGYDAYVVRKSVAGTNRLLDHANNLLADLAADRVNSPRPLIFVAHSLGGLVCKQALLTSREHPEPHLREIFDSTKGIIFLGTPHRGAWMADWASLPASILGIVKSTNTSLLRVLQTDDQFLESIQVGFSNMLRSLDQSRRIETTCFFEELPISGSSRVVSKASATLEGQIAISIHANHSHMVKFSSVEDTGFKRVVAELVRWESQIMSSADFGSFEYYLGSALKNIRILHEMFDESREIVDNEISLKPHEWTFKRTLILLGDGKLQLEDICLSLLQGLPTGQSAALRRHEKLWFGLDLQAKLQPHVAVNFHSIEGSIKKISSRLERMRQALDVWIEPKSSPGDPTDSTYQEKFIQTWSREQGPLQCEYFTQRLRREIDRLSQYVVGYEDSGSSAKGREPSERTMRYWLDLRSHTQRLFDLFRDEPTRACHAHNHQVRLRLQIPTRHQVDPACPQFLYSFKFENESGSGFAWRDIEIHSVQKSHGLSDTHSLSLSGKRTRFEVPTEEEDLDHELKEVCTSDTEIYSLCNTLRQQNQDDNCLGTLFGSGWCYHMHNAKRQSNNAGAKSVKLLLPHSNGANHLPLRQRRLIALALISAVVQLYDTPWLNDDWTIDDVSVDQKDQTRIYVTVTLDDKQTSADKTSQIKNPQPANTPYIRNLSLFSLAKALIELTRGGPLSLFWKSGDGNPDDSQTQWLIADRLTKDIQQKREAMGMPIQAIIWCMSPPSTDYSFTLSSEEFRRQYIRDVLLPLHQEIETLY